MQVTTGQWTVSELYKQIRTRLLWAVFQQAGDWQMAEDVCQEAFVRVLQKIAAGEEFTHPAAYLTKTAYGLVLDRQKRKRVIFMEMHQLELLSSRRASPFQKNEIELDSDAESSWEGFVYWSARIFHVVTASMSARKKNRVLVVFTSSSRSDALERLRAEGDLWSESGMCMALARYSAKLEPWLDELQRHGPRQPEEQRHWPLFENLLSRSPSHSTPSASPRNTLSWLIGGLHRLPPNEHQEFRARFEQLVHPAT